MASIVMALLEPPNDFAMTFLWELRDMCMDHHCIASAVRKPLSNKIVKGAFQIS